MTTWIDFRTEPIMDVPEVKVENLTGNRFNVICDNGFTCPGIVDWDNSKEAAIEIADSHVEWHAMGCPND